MSDPNAWAEAIIKVIIALAVTVVVVLVILGKA